MAKRHCESVSAAVCAAVALWAMCAAPAWANDGAGIADGQSKLQGASSAIRAAVSNQWLSGVDGASRGKSLTLFGSNQILSDASLFGVDSAPRGYFGSWAVTGRVDPNYIHAGTRPALPHSVSLAEGLHVAFDSFGPTRLSSLSDGEAGSVVDADPDSYFASELSYSSNFGGGNFKTWVNTLWHDTSPACAGLANLGAACRDNSRAWGFGSTIGYLGFELVGYFQDRKSSGLRSHFTQSALWSDAGGNVAGRKSDGYFVQGSYALNGKTKVGVSYSEGSFETSDRRGIAANVADKRVERQLWTVGVYHDVSSWLRLMAEYNRGELNTQSTRKDASANAISVGTFLYW